jgi:YgiT-type zinc finger domain-containing protein
MKCVICKSGDTEDGLATVTLNRGQSTIVIKDVPAQICENCGEYYLSDETSEKVLALAEDAIKHNAELEVLRFAA